MPESTKTSNMNKLKVQLVLSSLSRLSRNDLVNRDIFGRTILHILILCNRCDLLKNLLKNPDVKVLLTLTDYENGWNCMHYVVFHKRLSCYKTLINYLKNIQKGNSVASNSNLLFGLLRCKDRNKTTPLQLLGNDFKDLVWVPEYIDENNEYHLSYRFQDTTDSDNSDVNNDGTNGKKDLKKMLYVRQVNNWSNLKRGGSNIYMFGSNKNNNLGVGDATDRATPSMISHKYFRLGESDNRTIQRNLIRPRYKMIRISKNHSIVLTQDGSLYSCGIGSRGRLGHGFNNLNNTFRFKKIMFSEANEDDDNEPDRNEQIIRDLAISSNHSIALNTQNEVYSWGLNNFNQLGYTSSIASSLNSNSQKTFLEPFEGLPKKIILGDLRKNQNDLIGVTVSKIHSVAYTKNELIFWGLCIGQMGISMDTTATPVEHKVSNIAYRGFVQRNPKKVTLRDDIKYVLTSETCTCVVTTSNDIHVYYQYQHVKLPKIPVKGSTDKHFDLFKPTKLTQAINIEKICLRSHQFIALLLDNGDVMSFTLSQSETDDGSSKSLRNLKYNSLWKSYDRDMKVIDIDVSNDGSIVLCTRNGSAFIKTDSSQRMNSMTDVSLSISVVKNKFKRIESLNKIIKVSCDDNFLSFGFIRDDIDMIPFKLQSNDFFKDMEYLSCLSDTDLFRKQTQLLNFKHDDNSYTTDYLYPQRPKLHTNFDTSYHSIFQTHTPEDEGEADEIQSGEYNETSKKITRDILYERYINRHDFQKNKRIKSRNTYLYTSRVEDESLLNLLKSDILYVSYKLTANSDSNKRHDCLIKFEKFPDISIKIHKEFFIRRSPFCAKIFNPASICEYFVEEGFEGRFNPRMNELIFTNEINIKSVLIMIHFIYTNRVLSIWEDFPGGLNCPKDIKEIKHDFDKLIRLFSVTDLWARLPKNEVYLKRVRTLVSDEESGDVVIRLKDGEITCHSYVLIARSAFFETVLSDRWDNHSDEKNFKVLTLEDISLFQFDIILRHLYGYNDNELFDCLHDLDIDEFINCLLELIEISDELLLFQLKDLCQLGIKDLISLENILILSTHAYYLDAFKLFMNCCWFIYNNLEAILLDPSFNEIQDHMLGKLENQVLFFQYCKLIDFAGASKKFNENSLKSWMEWESNSLIFNFLSNMKDYNELFMSDKKGFQRFDPLIDIKYDQHKSTQECAKKKGEERSHSGTSRKDSTMSDVQVNLMDFRKVAASKLFENEDALDDSDGVFEVVNNKRRQSSKSDHVRSVSVLNSASPTPPTPPSSQPPSRSSVIDAQNIQVSRKSSLNGPHSTKTLLSDKNSQTISGSSHFNRLNKSNDTLLVDKQPILGKDTENKSSDQEFILQKKKSKTKFGPAVRLSQKERKKMASQILPDNNSNKEASETFNPWSKANNSTSIIDAIGSSKVDLPRLGSKGHSLKHPNEPNRKNSQSKTPDCPLLGSSKLSSKPENDINGKKPLPKLSDSSSVGNIVGKNILGNTQTKPPPYSTITHNVNKPVNRVYSTPSLTEIMIHESLKIEEAKIKETERKSLQEIQQEQQFSKWWEEEASRVQQQMSQMGINEDCQTNTSKKGSHGTNKTKKNRGNKPKSLNGNYDSAHITASNKTLGKQNKTANDCK